MRRLAGLFIATFLMFAPACRAGTYEVKSCLARGATADHAFVLLPGGRTRGMVTRHVCHADTDTKLIGVVTGEHGGGTRPRGARAILKLIAPPGTTITQIAWRGDAKRTDCGWEMSVYGATGRAVAGTVQEVPAGKHKNGEPCPRKPQPQVSRTRRLRTVTFPQGATRIVQRMVCRGYQSSRCSARGANYLRTAAARVTIVDNTPPSVQITGGSLLQGWVNREKDLQFSATDAVGVRSTQVFDRNSTPLTASDVRDCDISSTVPCPNGAGVLKVDTRRLSREGTQAIDLRALDAAGNTGATSAVIHVDNAPPARVDPVVDGGDSWRRSNAFALHWQNTPEADRAPITAAFYRLCRADGTRCSGTQRRGGDGISALAGVSVPGPGEWNLTMWREDAAGNVQPDNASAPAKVRFDPDPPKVAFEPSSSADPTQVALRVKEDLSGLATDQIEISKQGSATWQGLATERQVDRVVARVDDSKLEPGTYLVRAHVADRAGNEASTDRRADGSPMVLTLPLRVRSTMRAGVRRTATVRRRVKRHGKSHRIRRHVTRFVARSHAGLGHVIRFSGRLTDVAGKPLVGQTVYVGARSPVQSEHLAGTVTTDSRGRYSYLARASQNEIFRFAYLGTATVLPTQQEVTVLVPASSTLRTPRRRLLNGQRAIFTGRVRSMPVPASGKLVELQVKLTGRWQTFRTTHTNGQGRWRLAYRFRRTVGNQPYFFRAYLPAENGYPFQSGRSHVIKIRVRGRR